MRVRPHPFYGRESTREGDVLTIEVPLSPVEAALGAEIDVPVLDGARADARAARDAGGAQFRLRGKGFPRGAGARGDAHVRVAVETPAAVSDEARALLQRLGGR